MRDGAKQSGLARPTAVLLLLLPALLFALDRSALAQDTFTDVVDVQSGFARITVARDSELLRPTDFSVSWKGIQQRIQEVVGGRGSSIEVGLALDLSASMEGSLDSMRSAIGEFVKATVTSDDRVFVLSFADRTNLVAEGLDDSLAALATLSTEKAFGSRPTLFFEGTERALDAFHNSYARAVLLVASDGCDSLQKAGADRRLLDKAANMAIPIVLISPGRKDCRNTTCTLGPDGLWNCSTTDPPTYVRVGERDIRNPTGGAIDIPVSRLTSPATITRDRFTGQLKSGGGEIILARSDSDWRKGLASVRSLLDRQWMVVFEPSSPRVRSSEAKVKVHKSSRSKGREEPVREERKTETTATQPASVPGQSSTATVSTPASEQVNVEVVSVDVVATDKRGRRVLDLSREDFLLEVDGRPVAFDYFSGPGETGAERDAEQDPTPQFPASSPDGSIFIVIDRGTLEARVVKQLVEQLRSFVVSPEAAGENFVVASFADSPLLHTGGTRVPSEVHRALDDLIRAGGRASLRNLERRQLEADVLAATPRNIDLLLSEIESIEDQEISRQRAFLTSIQNLLKTSAHPENRNTLLIATAGFSMEPERYLRDLVRSVRGYRAGEALSGGDAAPSRNAFILAELDKLVQIAQERRVTAYTLLPAIHLSGPFSAQFRTMGRSAAAAPREETSRGEAAANVAKLADKTGGARFVIHSDLGKRMQGIASDLASSYSIGFHTGPEAGFDRHQIRISTPRPGVSLRFRTSYRRFSAEDRHQGALAAATQSGIVDPTIQIELLPEVSNPRVSKGKGASVPVLLKIPLGQLSFQPGVDGTSDLAVVAVQIAVSDAAGNYTTGPLETLEISVPRADAERARSDFWSHRTELILPAGEVRIGALLIENATGLTATASSTLTVIP